MARYEEQDFDEKRLARRQRRKQSQLIAYIILTLIIVFIAVAIGVGRRLTLRRNLSWKHHRRKRQSL